MSGVNFYFKLSKKVSEWVFINANSAIFSAISWWQQVNFQWDDDEVNFVLDQHAELDFHSAISLKQQSADRFWNIIPIPSQLVCSFSLMLSAKQRSNKYQFYNLWVFLIVAETHDLPHLRLAR